ncbi:Bug family tripartite tricarboxylate transporter substrate binding protein [Pigmentiphaga litoralis]|uniref:Bug family tripartite tricarboxylate transporter substrate binding protein n=1 Tax=Pigmentiphaga litoralis TaxID=516702 RepID=UPI001E2E50C8|nr:tripartite tricarboxylate transporter substrate binding protein [Pigmentiphaga litoralis]
MTFRPFPCTSVRTAPARSAWHLCAVVGAAVFGMATLQAAHADTGTFPNKPVRMVVGFAAGGGADVVARLVGAKMSESMGQQVVVENRPGATGTIAADSVARSPADGYSLFLGSQSTMVIAPNIYPKLPFDPLKSFTPVSQLVSMPLLLVVNPAKVSAKTVEELTKQIKANPSSMSYASSGAGGPQHIAGELYKHMLRADVTHVPYSGESGALADVLGGHIPYMFANLPVAMPHIQAGKLRALAITSLQRNPTAPDIPTMAEAGMKDFEVLTWYGVFAPAKTPAPVVQKLYTEMQQALAKPDLKAKLADQGLTTVASNPADFSRFVQNEVPKWSTLIKEFGIKAE